MRSFVFTVTAASLAASAGADVLVLDFDQDILSNAMVAGQIVDDEFGPDLAISVDNGGNGPDIAIVFDSANPTGNDDDLATPGYHPTNTVALGNMLIIPENDTDGNGDGLVDDPNDTGSGGSFNFAFATSTFDGFSVTLVDIEENGGSIELLLNGSVVGTTAIPGVGDNSVQTLADSGVLFDEMNINFVGSGAVGTVSFVPAPGAMSLAMIGGLVAARRRR